MDSAGQARATIRTYILVLSRKHKLADEEDPTASEIQLRTMSRWRSKAYMRYVRPSPYMLFH